MKIEKIKELLMLGEGQNVEFKSNYRNLNVIGQVVCSFLNAQGGYIVCGVEDNGKLIGIDGSDAGVKVLEQGVQQGLSPKALVSVQVQEVEGKSLLVLEVPAGQDLPYAFRDVIYIRVGQYTRKADIETIRDMVLRKQVEPERWERRFSSADIEHDTDMDEIRSAVADIQNARRAFFRDAQKPFGVLEDLYVAKYGRLTNGGDVLFARNPATRLPQVRVRAACFTDDKASDTFRDMKSFEGPLVSVLEQVFDFIVRNTPTTVQFLKNRLKRQDESLYPADAIREGLVNAFAHRDYAGPSGGISVHIYPKRLEIWNSGSLPEGITPEGLIKGHLSVLRNPDIAHVLYLRGFMEKLGRGSVLILHACKERGLPYPVWTSDEKAGVRLTFFAPELAKEVTPEVAGEVGTRLALSQHQVEILRKCMTEKGILELMAVTGRRDRTKFRHQVLNPLMEAGLIAMLIPDKPTSSKQKYLLTPEGKNYLEILKK
ncbi:MAG: RNA-binding domain-containing protein [Deltaproteobacteria bacterium]